MLPGTDGFRRSVLPVARGAVVVALVTLAAFRLHSNAAATGFLFLIAVVLNCLDSSFVAATMVSVMAVAALDYFFLDPIFTWNVSDPVDVAALASFTVTSVVVTGLSSKARKEARAARLERQNLQKLYEAAQCLLALDLEEEEHAKILETVRQVFGLQAACIFDASTAETHTTGLDSGALAKCTREAYILGKDFDEPLQGQSFRCLRAGKTVGAIGFQKLEGAGRMAGPLAALAAAGLERAGAVRRAGHAAAEAQAESLRAAILDALAHEFKTPLATILTAAGGLREAGPLQPEQTELADLVEAEAERLSHLSSRLLRLARLDREEVKPRLEPVNLVSIVGTVIERYSRQWPERQFLFEKHGKSNQMSADAGLLQLAVSQLIDNACRYSPIDSAVQVSVEYDHRSVTVIVWNSGTSIPPAEGARIFDRFYRGNDAQKVSSGTGLGLYIARKIAVAHGGTLELDGHRAVDGGVAFRFAFPLFVEAF